VLSLGEWHHVALWFLRTSSPSSRLARAPAPRSLACCSSRSPSSPLASSAAARAEAQAKAASAFTALANVFFVSLVALIPHTGLGIPVLVMSTFALLNTVQMGRDLWRSEGRRARLGWALVLSGLVVYGFELRLGWELFRNPAGMGSEGYLDALAFLMLGIYGIALARAWELLGAVPRRGLLGWLLFKRTRGEQEEVRSEQDDAQRSDLEDGT
jgi:hypothetical protein